MKLLVTGGCGFVGSALVPALLKAGHDVTVVDTMWFGNYLEPHPRLSVHTGNVTDTESVPMAGIEAVIHLANIANDPTVELSPVLSWEVNVLATMQLVERAIAHGVGQFIFASSGSVYGVKEEEQVTEELSLVPISAYNKTKMIAERVLLSYAGKLRVHCVRPATVCGLSTRMRLDLSVNMLTMQAVKNGRITVFGGAQVRPNIHLDDMVSVYLHFLTHDIPSGCYNAGFENLSLMTIAELVRSQVAAEVVVTGSNDPRSYRLNSDKLLATGFRPGKTVRDAIHEVADAITSGRLRDEERWYNIKWMKHVLESELRPA
jgi:nucleoside-diphosphate-sugar epimerase